MSAMRDTKYPPRTPTRSAKTTSTGRTRVEATTRGTTRYLTGFVARVTSASICSVTFIVPSSAAIDAPTRPETMSPANTGPSSRVIESATTVPTKLVAWNRWNPDQLCRARTIPVKVAVTRTTGSELTPTSSICLTMFRISDGGRNTQVTHERRKAKMFPRYSTSRNTRVPKVSRKATTPFFFALSGNDTPRDALSDLREKFIGDRAREAGEGVRGFPPPPPDDDLPPPPHPPNARGGPPPAIHAERASPPLPHDDDLRPDRHPGNAGDVQHRVIHADPAGHRHPVTVHPHRRGVREGAAVAVGVSQRNRCDPPLPRADELAPAADRMPVGKLLERDDPGEQTHHRRKSQFGPDPLRRQGTVEGDPRAHHVEDVLPVQEDE